MPNKEKSLWSRAFIQLLLLSTLTSTSFFMVNPLVSKYATLLGASLGTAGVIAGLFSFTALVARPFGALAADRLNKKYVLAGATAVMAIAAMGYGLASSLELLVLFRIIHGLAFAVSSTASSALIASILPRECLGEGIGYFGMGNILATAIGPNLGLFLSRQFSFHANFLISGLIVLLTAGMMLQLPLSHVKQIYTKNRKIQLADLISFEVLPLALIAGLISFSSGLVSSFLVLLGDTRGIQNIGTYFTLLAVCLFVVRPLTGKLSDRKGLTFVLYPAFILLMLEGVLLANATVLWVVLIAATVKAVGQGAAQPTLQAACMKKLGLERSGVAAATYFIGADIGQGFGPMLGGMISEHFGYAAMFYFCAVMMGMGMLLFLRYSVRERKLAFAEK